MRHIYIESFTHDARDALSKYLVGGFDINKNFVPALPRFRYPFATDIDIACLVAEEDDDYDAWFYIEDIIKEELSKAEQLVIGTTTYHFDIKRFDCDSTMEFLVQEVIAQVNEY